MVSWLVSPALLRSRNLKKIHQVKPTGPRTARRQTGTPSTSRATPCRRSEKRHRATSFSVGIIGDGASSTNATPSVQVSPPKRGPSTCGENIILRAPRQPEHARRRSQRQENCPWTPATTAAAEITASPASSEFITTRISCSTCSSSPPCPHPSSHSIGQMFQRRRRRKRPVLKHTSHQVVRTEEKNVELALTKCRCECPFATSGESRVRRGTRTGGQDTHTSQWQGGRLAACVAGWRAGRRREGEGEGEEGCGRRKTVSRNHSEPPLGRDGPPLPRAANHGNRKIGCA